MTKKPDLVNVVSAMSKMTNALEEAVNAFVTAPVLLDGKGQTVSSEDYDGGLLGGSCHFWADRSPF